MKPFKLNTCFNAVAVACLTFFLLLPAATAETTATGDRPPSRTLVWISVDGIRPDYLERADTPFFDRLRQDGAFSLSLIPLFPTLTFPSHTSQATGCGADRHGITGNVFYDNRRDRTYGYANLPWLLEAEPIWTTATRQGVATAVSDWPLSQRQTGRHAARYFNAQFDRGLSDTQRLERTLKIWRDDTEKPPLRLLMGWILGPDGTGHSYGPDAPETERRMAATDHLLAQFEQELLTGWERRREPGDELFLLVTSDHGMSEVHTLVNPRRCAGLPARGSPVRRVSNGNITHFFLNRMEDDGERAAMRETLLKRLRAYDFMTVYERDELPPAWRFRHTRRTGDIVAVLPRGYTFSNRIRGETLPAAEHGEPLGMHGYCPEANPEMKTVAFLQRYPTALGGHDLGPLRMERLHATAAYLLNIEPSPDAHPDPIAVPGLDEL